MPPQHICRNHASLIIPQLYHIGQVMTPPLYYEIISSYKLGTKALQAYSDSFLVTLAPALKKGAIYDNEALGMSQDTHGIQKIKVLIYLSNWSFIAIDLFAKEHLSEKLRFFIFGYNSMLFLLIKTRFSSLYLLLKWKNKYFYRTKSWLTV